MKISRYRFSNKTNSIYIPIILIIYRYIYYGAFLRLASKTFRPQFCLSQYRYARLRVIFNKENTAIWQTHVHVCLHDMCTRKINFSTVKLFFLHYFDQTRFFLRGLNENKYFYSILMVPLYVCLLQTAFLCNSCIQHEYERKMCVLKRNQLISSLQGMV